MGPVKLVWLTSLTLSSIVFVFVIHLLFRALLRFNENDLKQPEIIIQSLSCWLQHQKERSVFIMSSFIKICIDIIRCLLTCSCYHIITKGQRFRILRFCWQQCHHQLKQSLYIFYIFIISFFRWRQQKCSYSYFSFKVLKSIELKYTWILKNFKCSSFQFDEMSLTVIQKPMFVSLFTYKCY